MQILVWSILALCVSVVILWSTRAVEPSCPVCSKYEYEEKLLERVLRNELALKNTLEKITETHAKVEDTLKTIQEKNLKINDAISALEVKQRDIDKEIKTSLQSMFKEVQEKKKDLNDKVDSFIDAGIQNLTESVAEGKTSIQSLFKKNQEEKKDLNDKVDSFIDAGIQNLTKSVAEVKASLPSLFKEIQEKKQDLNDRVDSFIYAGIQNLTEYVADVTKTVHSLVAHTSKELDVIKAQSVVPLVMFHARHLNLDGPHTYIVNQDVVFKTVLVNEGGGYDPSTGHFTASVAGVYLFTVQNCPHTNHIVFLEITHKGNPLQRSGHWAKDADVCVSMQAFAKVAMGEKVSVRPSPISSIDSRDLNYYNEAFPWCSFAGFLVHL